MPLLLAWKIKFDLKIQLNTWGNYRILYHKTNKEGSTVLCSIVKYLGSSRALKKWGKTLDFVSYFPLHFFRALQLPAYLQQNRAQSRLLYLLIINNLSPVQLLTVPSPQNSLFNRWFSCDVIIFQNKEFYQFFLSFNFIRYRIL